MSLFQIEHNGLTTKIGDFVEFKSDIEQFGEVIKITKAQWGTGHEIILINEDGFLGEYIGGRTITTISSHDIF